MRLRGNSDIYGIYAVYDSSMYKFYLFILDICEFYMWIYKYIEIKYPGWKKLGCYVQGNRPSCFNVKRDFYMY